MQKFSKTEKSKQKVTETKTFTVPFNIKAIKENTAIETSITSKPSKEEIINQAFNYHSKGNISEATKYYQYCINQNFNDEKVFSNYGDILKNLGKLQEAEISTRKAIEINPNFAEAHSNMGNIFRDVRKL